MIPPDVVDRFWSYVNKTEHCWEWRGYRMPFGHGQFRANAIARRPMLSHRVSWMIANGPIPRGLCVCHKCDNPCCVRPDHLFLGTVGDNQRDMAKKGRHPRNKTGYLPTGKSHHYYKKGPKITREQAQTIRKSTGTNIEIGAKYGVDPSLISRIKSGEVWRE